MFSQIDELCNPFNRYKIGIVESHGNTSFLRKFPAILWKMTIEKESIVTTGYVYYDRVVEPYEMSPEDINEFKSLLAEQMHLNELRQKKLRQTQSPLQGFKPVDFARNEAVMVLQHEYAVTQADYEQPILGTFGAASCLILALYDDENKTAILGHIDTLVALDSLQNLFSSMTKENTVAHLFGGNSLSQDMCLDTVNLLEKNNIKIVNSEIVRDASSSASLAIDARTGQIYYPIKPNQLQKALDLGIRLQQVESLVGKSPLKECYKGKKLKERLKESVELSEKSVPKAAALPEAKTLTLGFLTHESINGKIKNQKDNYCGFKSGFLLK